MSNSAEEPESIRARLANDDAHCYQCGKFLWSLDGDRLSSDDSTFSRGFAGWRLTSDGIWCETAQAREERLQNEKQLSAKPLPDDRRFREEARLPKRIRLARNLYRGGDGDISRWNDPRTSPRWEQLYAALKLPAKVRCPRCQKINLITPSLPR